MTVSETVPLAAAPALMILASLAERRWGPQAAGLVAAAPVTALVGVVLVTSDLGPHAARRLALSTSCHVLAQVAMAITLFHVAGRLGMPAGLVAATGTYAGLAWLTGYLTPTVAIVLGLTAAVVGRSLLGTAGPAPAEPLPEPPSGTPIVMLRAGIALLAAAGIVVAAHVFGPLIGGAIGAYPIFSVTLACLVGSVHGISGLGNVLRGLIRALPAYLAFGLTYWVSAPGLGEFGALATATGTCCLAYCIVSGTRTRQVPPVAGPPVKKTSAPDPRPGAGSAGISLRTL